MSTSLDHWVPDIVKSIGHDLAERLEAVFSEAGVNPKVTRPKTEVKVHIDYDASLFMHRVQAQSRLRLGHQVSKIFVVESTLDEDATVKALLHVVRGLITQLTECLDQQLTDVLANQPNAYALASLFRSDYSDPRTLTDII